MEDSEMSFIGTSLKQHFGGGETYLSHTVGDFEYTPDHGNKTNFTFKPEGKIEGTKQDSDKLRFDILPVEALLEVVKVITYGEKKYPSLVDSNGNTVLNWKKLPDPQNRFFSAGQRHIYSDRIGEELDSETGYYHLAHAISNLMFQLQLKIERNSA